MFCPSLCLCTRLTFWCLCEAKIAPKRANFGRDLYPPPMSTIAAGEILVKLSATVIISVISNSSPMADLVQCNDGAIVMYVSNCWCKQCQIWWNSKQFARYVSAIALCATASDLPVFNLVHYGSWPRWSSCQLARPIGDEDCRQKTCAILKV